MITDYLEDIEITNPWKTLKPWQKTPYEKIHGRNIYKNQAGKYYVEKTINKERIRTGVYENFQEALEARDELIRNGWKIDDHESNQKEYYKNIYISCRHYTISKYAVFYGCTQTIEEALHYRDICKEHNWTNVPKPYELDLKTNNPYFDGLDFPVPERLIIPPKTPRSRGSISRISKQSYRVDMGDTYFGSYVTYEMAYYVRQEMNKVGWDKSKLQRVVDDYPVWYTWLMNFYQYIIPKYTGWCVNLTPKNNPEGKLEHLYFHNLEDALWERDLLLKYDWDEELLCECADDTKNPYYDMDLPPYPQRKIRRIADRKDRTELFNKLFDLIHNGGYYSQEQYCELAGTNPVTLRNILRNEYGIEWVDFLRLCENGEHPNEVLEQKKIIYTPDLSIHYDNTNYVSYHKREVSPYLIYHRNKETQQSEYFGAYPTRELADKISNDLQKCDWDKSQLKSIQAKHGWQSIVNSRRWVYPKEYTSKKTGETYIVHYQVRRKGVGNFGTYKDKRVADLVRDCCIMNDWDKGKLEDVKCFAYEVIDREGDYEGYQGYRLWGLSFL